jgi:hypothetical protein
MFLARIVPYSIALLLALLALMRWCAWRHRAARRHRAAVSRAIRWNREPAMPSGPVLQTLPIARSGKPRVQLPFRTQPVIER